MIDNTNALYCKQYSFRKKHCSPLVWLRK